MLLDLKAACRELLKNRWFTCITVLTLALGIGANTAIFGVVNRLLLSSLPYPDSERLVDLRLEALQAESWMPTLHSVASAWHERARSLDGIEAYEGRSLLAYDDRGARVVNGTRITPSLPAFLSVAPVLGRGFTADDAKPGAPAVTVLSYGVWQSDYGGANDVLGQAITLDEVSHVIVGVMPARWDAFMGPRRTDFWFPMSLEAPAEPGDFRIVEVLARLPRGVPLDAVTSELDALAKQVMAAQPLFGASEFRTRADGPADRLGTNTRDALFVLLGAVGLVLLVACSNVANLLLARGASRARELALRAALGASTWRLVRALFAECLVLALASGAAGIALGWLLLRALVRLRPDSLPALADVELDAAVFEFTFGVAILTAFLFGLAPAVQLASPRLANTLRHGAAGVVRSGSGARMRKLLVAAQMAMSVVLLVSAGLLIRSVIYLQSADLGFETSNLFTVQVALPRGRYEKPASREAVAEQLLERIRALPGVVAATQAFPQIPFAMSSGVGNLEIRGVTLSEIDARAPRYFGNVRADYFDTLGIRMLEGRTFTTDEVLNNSAVIVNRAAAQRYWPDGRALGTEIKSVRATTWTTVVGIVDNVVSATSTLVRDAPIFYTPFHAGTAPTIVGAPPIQILTIRAAEDPARAIDAVRVATRELDPEIAIPVVQMIDDALASMTAAPRFNMALLTAFALIALVLAAVGLAAVIGYEVTERTHEIGIRMALGARTENVRRLAMRHGLAPAFVGVVIGVAGALAATQLATSLLHGVAPRDPLTFVGVVALLVLVALGASWFPARRATRVDPITALRAD